MRRWVLSALAAGTMALAAAPAANASVASEVSIHFKASNDTFHGIVSSTDKECQAGRTVRLFKRTADGPALQGRKKTDADGGWRIEVMHPHGHYFARIPTQKIMHTTCDGARSRTIDVM